MTRRVALRLVLTALALAAGPRAGAQEIPGFTAAVPGDYPTIQAAVDAAPKDAPVEIVLSARTYAESVSIAGFTDFTLRGESGTRIVSTGGGPAIHAESCALFEVRDVDVASDGVGIHLLAVSHGVIADLNVEAGGHGVFVETAGLPLPDVGGRSTRTGAVDIYGCRIEDAGGDGIRVLGTTGVGVSMSEILRPEGDGLHVDCAADRIVLQNLIITQPAGDGMDINATAAALGGRRPRPVRVTVGTAVLRNVGGDGVRFAGDAQTPGVTGVQILGAGGHGIVAADGVRFAGVTGCDVRGVDGDAIRGSARRVRGNTIADVGGDGIRVSDPEDVEGNTVSRAGGDGIRLDGMAPEGRARVHGNTVDGCFGSGIHLATAQRMKVAGNVVKGAQTTGYRLAAESSGSSLQRNRASDCTVALDVEDGSSRNRIRGTNRFGR